MTIDLTAIGIIRDHIESWRRSNSWSRETTAQTIVETHERLGFDRVSSIAFDPPTRDTFERQRVNADRIFRWLDDTTKDRNLLPVNFLLSILAALPMDRRIALVDELLEPVGLGAREEATFIGMDPGAGDDKTVVVMHFQDVLRTGTEAQVHMSKLLDGVDPGEPEAAKAKLSVAMAAFNRARSLMGRIVRRRGCPGAKP
jgi:hypothetical protein